MIPNNIQLYRNQAKIHGIFKSKINFAFAWALALVGIFGQLLKKMDNSSYMFLYKFDDRPFRHQNQLNQSIFQNGNHRILKCKRFESVLFKTWQKTIPVSKIIFPKCSCGDFKMNYKQKVQAVCRPQVLIQKIFIFRGFRPDLGFILTVPSLRPPTDRRHGLLSSESI